LARLKFGHSVIDPLLRVSRRDTAKVRQCALVHRDRLLQCVDASDVLLTSEIFAGGLDLGLDGLGGLHGNLSEHVSCQYADVRGLAKRLLDRLTHRHRVASEQAHCDGLRRCLDYIEDIHEASIALDAYDTNRQLARLYGRHSFHVTSYQHVTFPVEYEVS
jgi:hypothetical protein